MSTATRPKNSSVSYRSRSLSPARFDLATIAVSKDGGAVCLVGSSHWELETAWKKLMPNTPFNKLLVQQVRILPAQKK